MKVTRLLLAAAAIALYPELSSAQEERHPSEPECWASLPVVDTIRQVFEVHAEEHRLWRSTNLAGLSTDYLTSVAAGIAPHVRLPAHIDARAFTVWIRKDPLPSLAARIMSAAVTYRPLPGGPIGNVHLYGVGSSPAMERALAQAIISADSAGSIPPLPPGSYSKDLTLEISIGMRAQPAESTDTLRRMPVHVGASRPVAAGHAYVERYRVDHGVAPRAGTQRVPYPAAARRVRAGDSVTMEFLVDEAGRAHADKAVLRSATYPEFVDAVAKALPRMRFRPARSGACGLAVVVRQSFVFSIPR
jgi:TonB family protein